MSYWGGIEAGGTKFVCGVCSDDGRVLDRQIISTRDPTSTITDVVKYFETIRSRYSLRGIGLASFGPIDLQSQSDTYGYITSTPKERWRNFNIKGVLQEKLDCCIPIDTDVNAAVLAEHTWGAGMGIDNLVYITVGTGIGGGIMVNGSVVHGLLHPEIGHMRIRTDARYGDFAGVCPYHEFCLEGLASGEAIRERWGMDAELLKNHHQAWQIEAVILAEGIVNILLTVSPERFILGGGVMQQMQLFPMIREYVQELLNGYIQKHEIIVNIKNYIIPPKLGTDVGLLGAAVLSMRKEKVR